MNTFFMDCPHGEDYEGMLEQTTEDAADKGVSKNRVRLRTGVYAQVDKSIQIEARLSALPLPNSQRANPRKSALKRRQIHLERCRFGLGGRP
jgi:hypothetical protein